MWNKQQLLAKLTLVSPGTTKEARLRVSGYKNFLRWQVFIVDLTGKEKMKMALHIPMNRHAFMVAQEEIAKLPERKADYSFVIEVLKPIWDNQTNKMTDEKAVAGYITIGKRAVEDGEVNYIMLMDADKNHKFVFKLLPTPFIKLFRNGKELSVTEKSDIWASAHAKVMEQVLELFPEMWDDEDTPLGDGGNTYTKAAAKAKQENKSESKSDTKVDDVDFDDVF